MTRKTINIDGEDVSVLHHVQSPLYMEEAANLIDKLNSMLINVISVELHERKINLHVVPSVSFYRSSDEETIDQHTFNTLIDMADGHRITWVDIGGRVSHHYRFLIDGTPSIEILFLSEWLFS